MAYERCERRSLASAHQRSVYRAHGLNSAAARPRHVARAGDLAQRRRLQGLHRADALRWVADFADVTLDDRPATRETRRAIGERREREQRELQEAGFFRFAAVRMAEEILDVLPEAVPERSGPTQLRLALRTAEGAALLAIYRDFRSREPRLTAGLVFSGERAWNRLCKRLALSIEVQHVA